MRANGWKLTLVTALFTACGGAQVLPLDQIKNQHQLEQTLQALDAALFDSYNRCDLVKFRSFFDDHVEFYHDQGGVTLGKEALAESVRTNICGGDVRRELVPGSMQIYPMKGFGAVQLGVHRFYHPQSKTAPGEGRFVHLWQYRDGSWKITRAISYDHHPAAK
jgi:hypothetical protein